MKVLFVLFLTAASLLPVTLLWAETGDLKVVPDKCISLRKGQTCYQRVEFRWQKIPAGDVCLWRMDLDVPIKCWIDSSIRRYRYKFAANKTAVFSLIDPTTDKVLARTELKVSWIYNKRKEGRSSWRLF